MHAHWCMHAHVHTQMHAHMHAHLHAYICGCSLVRGPGQLVAIVPNRSESFRIVPNRPNRSESFRIVPNRSESFMLYLMCIKLTLISAGTSWWRYKSILNPKSSNTLKKAFQNSKSQLSHNTLKSELPSDNPCWLGTASAAGHCIPIPELQRGLCY